MMTSDAAPSVYRPSYQTTVVNRGPSCTVCGITRFGHGWSRRWDVRRMLVIAVSCIIPPEAQQSGVQSPLARTFLNWIRTLFPSPINTLENMTHGQDEGPVGIERRTSFSNTARTRTWPRSTRASENIRSGLPAFLSPRNGRQEECEVGLNPRVSTRRRRFVEGL